MTSQGSLKWSKLYYLHKNIAIFTSCPKLPKWCQKVPKRLQSETLGPPKRTKVEPSGTLRAPRGGQNAPRFEKKSPWETSWNPRWIQSGPNALQGSTFEWISGFWTAFCCNCGLNGSVFSKAWLKLWWQRLSNHCCVSAYATRIGGTGHKAITMRRGRDPPCRQRRARPHITSCQRHANALQRKKKKKR